MAWPQSPHCNTWTSGIHAWAAVREISCQDSKSTKHPQLELLDHLSMMAGRAKDSRVVFGKGNVKVMR